MQPGELVHVETWDCYRGKIHPRQPNPSSLQRDDLNPVTGPLYVQGAAPGDVLSVTLHDIRPTTRGVAICNNVAGQLAHTVTSGPWCTRFFDICMDTKMVSMLEEDDDAPTQRIAPIQFDCSPMLGVVGVAPAGTDEIPTMPAGKHGGNLDNKCNGVGCTLHLPVNHPGALLSIGDMHASQGDGEICGTGVEVGGDVLLSCQVIKRTDLQLQQQKGNGDPDDNFVLEYPVTETATHWITHGVTVENIPDATTVACEQAQKLLMGQWGFTAEEAFILMSVKADVGFCQACHPDRGTQIAKVGGSQIAVLSETFSMPVRQEPQSGNRLLIRED